jgi:hypothetical protein
MELILWQDWRKQGQWKSCWTAHVRADVQVMPAEEQNLWSDLFQSFPHCSQIEPTKKWLASSKRPFERLTGQAFRMRLAEWLKQPSRVPRP